MSAPDRCVLVDETCTPGAAFRGQVPPDFYAFEEGVSSWDGKNWVMAETVLALPIEETMFSAPAYNESESDLSVDAWTRVPREHCFVAVADPLFGEDVYTA